MPQITVNLSAPRKNFIKIFANKIAKEFQRKNLIACFTRGIMENHSYSENLSEALTEAKCAQLINLLYHQFSSETLTEIPASFSLPNSFEELKTAYRNYRQFRQPRKHKLFLSPYFYGQSLINIGKEDRLTSHLALDNTRRFSKITNSDPNRPLERHDSALFSSSLHNLDNPVELLQKLQKLGFKRLLIEEEVLISSRDQNLPLSGLNEIKKTTQKDAMLRQYLQMPVSTQLASIHIAEFATSLCLDGRAAVNISANYNTISHWVRLFFNTGWSVEKVKVTGFQEESFKPVCKALFILNNSLS